MADIFLKLTNISKHYTGVAWYRKHFQLPITLDFEEDLENAYETEDGTQLHKLAAFKKDLAEKVARKDRDLQGRLNR